ncbi:DUF2182 domain-containing protein [bacterium]|nr:DUF2182 domain-containing protein [bacterium]
MPPILSSHGNGKLMPMQLIAATVAGRKRSRVFLMGSLGILIAMCWAYTIRMTLHQHISMTSTLAMPDMEAWSVEKLTMAVAMWAIMMAAMMLPSVAPWIMALSQVLPKREPTLSSASSAAGFIAGYLVIWLGYSVIAALMQAVLSQQAMLSPALVATSPILGGVLLILAGGYQWTPAKSACLKHCRTPVGFFLTSWKAGRWGSFHMGFKHGLYCVGCCWAIMALSFVAGVMNLLWMMLITIYIFIDHNLPVPALFGKMVGIVLIAWGTLMLALGPK